MKIIKQILILICLVALLTLPYFVFAQANLSNAFGGEGSPLEGVSSVAGYAEATPTSLAQTVGIIISVFLSFLGIIFVILIIYGGYLWMTARGNEQQVEKAKDTLQKAIIGLVIILSSWGIYALIWYKLIV